MIINQIAAGGGSAEGACVYNVYSLAVSNGRSLTNYITSKKTITYYDEVAIDENGEIVVVGDAKSVEITVNDAGVTTANNTLAGKYEKDSNSVHKNISFDGGAGRISRTYYKLSVDKTLIRSGVTDDTTKYATLKKCVDGFFRENAE